MHAWAPSLAESNSMRTNNKADLLKCLEHLVTPPESTPDVDAKIFDGSALDQKYSPTDRGQNFPTVCRSCHCALLAQAPTECQ